MNSLGFDTGLIDVSSCAIDLNDEDCKQDPDAL